MGSISPDGRISFCAQYWKKDLFSNKFEPGVKISLPVKKPDQCSFCIAGNVCGGPCLINYKKNKSIDENKCLFYRHFLKIFLENPDMFLNENQIDYR